MTDQGKVSVNIGKEYLLKTMKEDLAALEQLDKDLKDEESVQYQTFVLFGDVAGQIAENRKQIEKLKKLIEIVEKN